MRYKLTSDRYVWVLVAAAIAVRIAFRFVYDVWWNPDSASYAYTAVVLLQGHFDKYDGIRTPIYPLFIGLLQFLFTNRISNPLMHNAQWVVSIAQSEIGVIGVVLLYLLMLRMQITRKTAFITALFFAGLVQVVVYEMLILSESLAVFFVVWSSYLLIRTSSRIRSHKPYMRMAVWTGFIGGISALVRPNNLIFMLTYIACAALLALLQWMKNRPEFARALFRSCLAITLAMSLPLGGWITFNRYCTGIWSLSTAASYNRAGIAYNLFDRVKPQDKALGGIMNKYYTLFQKSGIECEGYIVFATRDIVWHTHEMPFQFKAGYPQGPFLYMYIGKVSDDLLIHNPGVWLANGLDNFKHSFDFPLFAAEPEKVPAPVYEAWTSGNPLKDGNNDPSIKDLPFDSPVISAKGIRIVEAVGVVEQQLLLISYIASFVVLLVAALDMLRAQDEKAALFAFVPFAMAAGSIASIVTTCFLIHYFPRYGMPYYPLLIACGAWLYHRLRYGRQGTKA